MSGSKGASPLSSQTLGRERAAGAHLARAIGAYDAAALGLYYRFVADANLTPALHEMPFRNPRTPNELCF
jgi:enoyl-CoA hydratase/carnithine racemase